ncbi:MAG: Holliday junction resolvase RuvX [Bacteroidia bacterium]|nr:Holliday junction resolvase RuvX [Bacteroidia bacterium]
MRILAIDYGARRSGLAWTDPLRIIATGLGTVDTPQLEARIRSLIGSGEVTELVLGYPVRMDGSDSHVTEAIRELAERLRTAYPQVPVHFQDEQQSSRRASEAMIAGGVRKKQRRDRLLINEVSAVLILQDYMDRM